MANEVKPDGHVVMRKGRQVLRFVRHIDRPIEKVWAALVVPERVADWMGEAEIEPCVGGKYNITFGDDGSKAAGVIEHFDPPRLLAYTWGGAGNREHPGVIYELETEGAGCKLALTTQFPNEPHGDPAEAVATWHEFLLAIPLAADGIRMAWDEARRTRWKGLFEPYRAMLAEAGRAPVQVRITRIFDASPERVFDAWLDTGSLSKWMFGPAVRDEEIVRLLLEARVGGKFSFVVRRQGQLVDHVGEYLEINRPRRLVFTWGIAGSDSSRVAIEINRLANGCELVLTHELHPDWAAFAGRTEQGWTHMLDKLIGVLKGG